MKASSLFRKMSVEEKNFCTPLHVAAQRGYSSICWILLIESELSLNDLDSYSNTPLHTAAANGHARVVRIFIETGADCEAKNCHNLLPLDVAANEDCRVLLRQAIMKHQNITHSREGLKRESIERYKKIENDLLCMINSSTLSYEDVTILKRKLESVSKVGIKGQIIHQGFSCVKSLELLQELNDLIDDVKDQSPIDSPSKMKEVLGLQKKIEEIKKNQEELATTNLSLESTIANVRLAAENLLCDSLAEFQLQNACQYFKHTNCAKSKDIKCMDLLREAIEKARERLKEGGFFNEASSLLTRLTSELELEAACVSIPQVRLPILEMTAKEAKGYWQPEDVGHIEETPEFPLLPSGCDEYIWVKSKSLTSFEQAIQCLFEKIKQAEKSNSNIDLIKQSSILLSKKRDDLVTLQRKNEDDWGASKIIAEKAAKRKLKKKKGKKA